VFAAYQDGGYTCVEVFFFRTGQNWGNRAYFPKADRTLTAAEVLDAFLAQFYDDKPAPRLILISHDIEDRDLLGEALTTKTGRKVEVNVPQRGEKKDLVAQAMSNAKEALGRKLAESSSQNKLLVGLAQTFGLPKAPRRIEVYDNSHIQGTNAVGTMIVAGPEGFQKGQYRKFNIRSTAITPGDDYGMMREVLERRFKRLMTDSPRPATGFEEAPQAELSGTPVEADQGILARLADAGSALLDKLVPEAAAEADDVESPWPDLLLIDGGQGQLKAVTDTMAALGVTGVAVVGIAKGPDRDAGNETFFMQGRAPFRLPPRDPLLYFVQRMRDEAHRFAIGSHRARRKRDIRESGLQEIVGVGPTRKRALLHHFGTLKAIERASLPDLSAVPGISAETARKIYQYFHEK
jgi:excinuclease ABC subunit C